MHRTELPTTKSPQNHKNQKSLWIQSNSPPKKHPKKQNPSSLSHQTDVTGTQPQIPEHHHPQPTSDSYCKIQQISHP